MVGSPRDATATPFPSSVETHWPYVPRPEAWPFNGASALLAAHARLHNVQEGNLSLESSRFDLSHQAADERDAPSA